VDEKGLSSVRLDHLTDIVFVRSKADLAAVLARGFDRNFFLKHDECVDSCYVTETSSRDAPAFKMPCRMLLCSALSSLAGYAPMRTKSLINLVL
jgi:hypothetical protein